MSRVVAGGSAVLLLLLATAGPASADRPYAVPTPVATGVGTQCSPSLGGAKWNPTLAWSDDGSGQWDVFWLSRLVATLVPAGPSAQRHPASEGYLVAYEDDRAGNWDIFLYDTYPSDPYSTPPPAAPEKQLTDGAADQLDPDISYDKVVYEDTGRGNADIAIYDLATSSSRLLTTNRAAQVDPSIDDDKVVFADRRNGQWDVYCYDLTKKTLKRLTMNGAAQVKPDVADGIVVYQDKRNGNWDVYSYNLKSRKERRLTTDRHDQTAPRIGGDRSVVYEDDRAGQADLWVCDLKTGLHRRVTDGAAAQTEPTLAGATVAWRDASVDGGDIFMTELLYPSLSLGWATSTPGTPPAYGSNVRFAGYLRLDHGVVDGKRVTVSGTGGTRKVAVVPVDETTGRFSVTLRNVVRKVSLRALFNDPGYLPDKAGPVTVKPKALLTRPSFTVLPRPPGIYPLGGPRDVVVSGYLKPRHRAGSRAVKIECWQYVVSLISGGSSHWELKKTVRAKVTDFSGYSAYRVQLTLTSGFPSTKWKVRAIHEDADHAKTISSFSAVRNLR